jgi:hypothetical protein
MGNPIHFFNSTEYFWFNAAFSFLCAVEFLIWLFTSSRWARHGERAKPDPSMWLIELGWAGGVYLSFLLQSHSVPAAVRSLLLQFSFLIWALPVSFCLHGAEEFFFPVGFMRRFHQYRLKFAEGKPSLTDKTPEGNKKGRSKRLCPF